MVAMSVDNYLQLTLREEHAARTATSAEARRWHEELAIAYEISCLVGKHSTFGHAHSQAEQRNPLHQAGVDQRRRGERVRKHEHS